MSKLLALVGVVRSFSGDLNWGTRETIFGDCAVTTQINLNVRKCSGLNTHPSLRYGKINSKFEELEIFKNRDLIFRLLEIFFVKIVWPSRYFRVPVNCQKM